LAEITNDMSDDITLCESAEFDEKLSNLITTLRRKMNS
jgi:hypothetical protein